MKTEKQILGTKGEELAISYLKENGYSIQERNWRYRKTEIDIIAKKEDKLIFIEVKTRSADYFGEPASFVDEKQMQRISAGASTYMRQINYDWEVRFDIIGILFKSPQASELKHYKDVWF